MNEDERAIIYDVTDGIASPETKKKYAYHFNRFLEHFDLPSPESLLTIGEKTIEAMIFRWIKHLYYERHQRQSTIHAEVAAVLHFLSWNDVRLNTKKINQSIPRDETQRKREDRHYSYKEIEQILSKCDERGRVIIYLMESCGCRLGALPGLRFDDMTEVPEHNLYKIQVYARTRDSYYTFCTPECRKTIDEYRIFREVHGETLESSSPLIRELFDTRVRFAAEKPKPMTIEGLESLMHRVLLRSEVKSTDVMRSHGLRMFFVSMCIKARMDYNAREYITGHKHSRGLDVDYDRTEDEDRLKEYLKAIPFLTIDRKQRLEQENEELRKVKNDYLSELGDLRHDFNEMKQLFVHLNKDSQKQLINEFNQKVEDKADIEWSCDD